MSSKGQNLAHPALGRFDDFDRFADATMGKFAADYRSQSGELPSETLRRSAR